MSEVTASVPSSISDTAATPAVSDADIFDGLDFKTNDGGDWMDDFLSSEIEPDQVQSEDLEEPAPPVTHKVKINGKTENKTVDELIEGYQKFEGLKGKVEKLEQYRHETAKLNEKLGYVDQQLQYLGYIIKNGDIESLSTLFQKAGANLDNLVIQRYKELVDESMMTPEQKEIRKTQLEHKKLKEHFENQYKKEQMQIRQTHARNAANLIDNQMLDAFKANGVDLHEMSKSNKQATALLINDFANLFQGFIKTGKLDVMKMTDADWAKVSDRLVKEIKKTRSVSGVTDLSDDEILARLGKERVTALNKKTQGRTQYVASQNTKPPKAGSGKNGKISHNDFINGKF